MAKPLLFWPLSQHHSKRDLILNSLNQIHPINPCFHQLPQKILPQYPVVKLCQPASRTHPAHRRKTRKPRPRQIHLAHSRKITRRPKGLPRQRPFRQKCLIKSFRLPTLVHACRNQFGHPVMLALRKPDPKIDFVWRCDLLAKKLSQRSSVDPTHHFIGQKPNRSRMIPMLSNLPLRLLFFQRSNNRFPIPDRHLVIERR